MVTLFITTEGTIEGIYTDVMSGLLCEGEPSVTRASHVEPSIDENGQLCWYADMSPSGGPLLGPFYLRSLALEAEVEWIHREKYGKV